MPHSKTFPLRDFFKNPERSSFTLSPSGRFLAFRAPHQSRLNVFVQPLDGGEASDITDEVERDIHGYFWKTDDRVVYVKDFGGDENFHLVAASRDGKSSKDLTPFPGVRAEVVDDLEDHPTDMLVALNKRTAEAFDVYRLNTATGELRLIAENPGTVMKWLTDHEGVLRVGLSSDGVNQTLLYRANEQEPFKALLTTSFKETVNPLFFTFDNKRLFVESNRGRDRTAVFELDPLTVTEGKLIYEHPEVDVGVVAYSRKRKVLTFGESTTWKPERTFFDEQTRKMYEDVAAKLPGYELTAQAHDLEEKFIFAAWNDRTVGRRFVYDVKTGTLTSLGELMPWLPENEMASMKPIQYRARDGLLIHGYLTVPKGREPKNLPIIVNPHGGPWTRDTWGFNQEIQFLANRGYAVLQMNFRGSVGYGRKFWEASFKQWGRAMQDDVTDGVKHLIAEGIADPNWIAIYGASYGGYATLAGVAFTPDLYTCAVDYVGVSNMFTFMNTIPPYWKPMLDQIHEMVGDPEKDKELLTAVSPALHADRIRVPLLVVQGAQDPRVNVNESNQMVEALRRRGVVVEYLVKENEGHGFMNEENRFEMYEAMEKFFARHMRAA